MKSYTQAELLALRDQHEKTLQALPGVVGTGVGLDGTGGICLKVFTNHASPETKETIRQLVGDAPLKVEESGEIHKATT